MGDGMEKADLGPHGAVVMTVMVMDLPAWGRGN